MACAARLGEIDFFFSHSWHDDYKAKWAALVRFAKRFAEGHHRAPLLWLDKACLNQADIAGSLAHLPVHMAGCKKLVIIAGATYSSRLWTLLELYVWVSMGKEASHVRCFLIDKDPTASVEQAHSTQTSPLGLTDSSLVTPRLPQHPLRHPPWHTSLDTSQATLAPAPPHP
jgi:hypothetical protein